MKKDDGMIEWQGLGQIGKWPSCARVRVYENDGMQIAIAEEPENYEGSPLKDCSGIAAGLAIQKFEMDINKFVWIEKTMPKIKGMKFYQIEHLDLVMFEVKLLPNPLNPKTPKARLVNPERISLTPAQLESLIGEPLS